MKKMLAAFSRKVAGDTKQSAFELDFMARLVDHIIRIFTALGFVTGLIQLRKIHPDNVVLIGLLSIIGFALFYYLMFIIHHVTVRAGEAINIDVKARKIIAFVTTTAFSIAIVMYLEKIGDYLSEINLFG